MKYFVALNICIMLILPLALPGCSPRPADNPTGDAEDVVDSVPVGQLVDAHNQRSQRLQQLYASGVVEIEWQDEDGKRRREQGDIELWISQPFQTALRIHKLGEDVAWIGSDADRVWMFDLSGDEIVLTTYRTGRSDDASEPSTPREQVVGLPIHPLTLLDLAGITMVEPVVDRSRDAEISAGDLLGFGAHGTGGLINLYFEEGNGRPLRVEAVGLDREVVLRSRLRRPFRVHVPGQLELNWPQMPSHVNIDAVDESLLLLLVLEDATVDMTNQPLDAVFDLERLQQRWPPGEIISE